MVFDPGPYPFKGEVIWLTPDQGGLRDGVPEVHEEFSFAHVAHVPPHIARNGSASFVLRGWDPTLWRSRAEGKWLFGENDGPQLVRPGSVVCVTVGTRTVAFFVVETVTSSRPATATPAPT